MIQLLIPSALLVQGQLWESGADAVTHAWSLGCWQKLGQPGARDLPAGMEGWQGATTQLGKGSRLPALGFLSPSGNCYSSHCSHQAFPLSHAWQQGCAPLSGLTGDTGRRPGPTVCPPTPPSTRHWIVAITNPTLLMRKPRPQKLWVAEPGVLLGLTHSLHCPPLPPKEGDNGNERERRRSSVCFNKYRNANSHPRV